MSAAAQTLVDALSLGGLYALAALGIGLIFGVMRLVNFAHGELVTGAAYVLVVLGTGSPALAIGAAVLTAALLALAMEAAVFRALEGAGMETLLIASFALSFLLQKVFILFVDARPIGVDLLAGLSAPVELLGLRTQALQLTAIGASAALLLGLTLFLTRTRLGLEMRATAENPRMARLLGVRSRRVGLTAFALSGILAAAAAVLIVAQTGVVQPRMGVPIVTVAFVGAVIGGLGNLAGSAVGGFLVGAATVALQALLPPDLRPFRDALVFLAVIAVLLLRPQGLIPAPGLRERV